MKGYAPVREEPGPAPRGLLADNGYDAAFILAERNRKIQPVIDGHIYSLRSLVERCFSKLKHSRRLAI